jgi:hypothetical protein
MTTTMKLVCDRLPKKVSNTSYPESDISVLIADGNGLRTQQSQSSSPIVLLVGVIAPAICILSKEGAFGRR